MLPLHGPLAEGHVFPWFALNIPMDLGTGGMFTSDIDVIAKLRQYPKHAPWRPYPSIPAGSHFYKTWEVKVSLLCKDGTARSIKGGKTRATLNQLRAYRKFGSPDVSLLELYLCEDGFMRSNDFPPAPVRRAIDSKIDILRANGFGYQILPFEHGKSNIGEDLGLLAYSNETRYDSSSTNFRVLPQTRTESLDGFAKLIERLDQCYQHGLERLLDKSRGFTTIVFCRACRQLGLTTMKEASRCPRCADDLRLQ